MRLGLLVMFWLIHALRSMIDGRAVDGRTNVRDRRAAIGRRLGVAVSAAVLIAAFPVHADETAQSTPEPAATSDAPDGDGSIRSITIEMKPLSFNRKSISVTAGETVRFVLKNVGEIPHEFTIGTPLVQSARRAVMREMFDAEVLMEYLADAPVRAAPNSVIILGGETREMIWTFTETQDMEFGDNLPLHYEAGMRGSIHVSIPGKSDAVAAHGDSGDGEPENAGTNGLANLAQLMAKAKEAVNGTGQTATAAESGQSGTSSDNQAPAEGASSAQAGAAEAGDTQETESEPSEEQPEKSVAVKTAAVALETDQNAGAKPEGDQDGADRKGEQGREEGSNTNEIAATDGAATADPARPPEYRAFDRGLALMNKGDILGARVEFERSATAEAALALGRSYDENYLSRIENPNATPDANTARQWYEAWYRISVRQGAISAETNLDLLIEAMTNE